MWDRETAESSIYSCKHEQPLSSTSIGNIKRAKILFNPNIMQFLARQIGTNTVMQEKDYSHVVPRVKSVALAG